MKLVWNWVSDDKSEAQMIHPILAMSNWLYDAQASQAAGRSIFRLPYPGGDWITEKQKNSYLVYLMDMAKRVAVLAYKSKKREKLTKEEQKLLDKVAEVL